MEQVAGIGPANCAWEAHILPLNYTCKLDISIITYLIDFCKYFRILVMFLPNFYQNLFKYFYNFCDYDIINTEVL